jgi:hypothetical protein
VLDRRPLVVRRVALQIESPRQDTLAAGLVPARKSRPVVTAFAAREGQTLRLMILNKDVARTTSVTVAASDKNPPAVSGASQGEVWTADYFGDGDAADVWSERPLSARALPVTIDLKPHSVSFVEIELAPPSPRKQAPARPRR